MASPVTALTPRLLGHVFSIHSLMFIFWTWCCMPITPALAKLSEAGGL